MEPTGKLSNLQLELLKMFKYDLGDKQLKDIKGLLGKYFADTASEEMDRLWEEKNWNAETMGQWAKEHLRKQG